MNLKAFSAPKIFDGQSFLDDHVILVDGNIIEKVFPSGEIGSSLPVTKLSGMIIPAYIDVQVYGAKEQLFSAYPGTASLSALATHNYESGTALCLPTVATNSPDVFKQCLDAIRAYWDQRGEGIGGLHLEGPWISVNRRGAHCQEFIHPPHIDEVKDLLDYGKDVIRMITLAPEVCSDEIISLLLENGIIISAGHSDIDYDLAKKKFSAGIERVTHLFNAMSPFMHRAPGLAGAAMDDERVMAGIIPDGWHVDFAAVRIAHKAMGDRLFAITDAVTATSKGPYLHTLKNGRYESDGILSGSALTMHQAFLNLVNRCSIKLEQAIQMCSLYPARALKLNNQYGLLKPGFRAKFNVMDEKFNIKPVH